MLIFLTIFSIHPCAYTTPMLRYRNVAVEMTKKKFLNFKNYFLSLQSD